MHNSNINILNKYIYKSYIHLAKNTFPSHYAQGIASNNEPTEHQIEYATLEYTLDENFHPPCYIFVIDKCITEIEMKS